MAQTEFRMQVEACAQGVDVSARERAVAKAEARAVAQALAAIVGTARYEAVRGLAADAAEFVYNTRILEGGVEGGQYRISIETCINRPLLRARAARELAPRLPFAPRAVVLTTERIGGAPPALSDHAGVAEALAEALGRAHVEAAGVEALRAALPDAKLLALAQGGLEGARELARALTADVLVLAHAEAEARKSAAAGNVWRAEARVTAQVLRVPDGKVLEALTEHAAVAGAVPWESTGQAVRDAADKLKGAVAVAAVLCAAEPVERDGVLVTLQEAPGRYCVDEVLEVLRAQAASGAVEELYWTPPEARFNVAYGGAVADLVRTLTRRDYSDFVVEVARAVGREVTLRIVTL